MMTQKDLLHIVAIAETGSLSKAAEKLSLVQSSLSHSLQKIESELGVVLFSRSSAGLKPTVAGEYYLSTAHQILSMYEQLETQISWLNDMKAGRIAIGTTSFLGSVILPHILYVFTELYPRVAVQLSEGVSQQMERDVVDGHVDIAILHAPISNQAIRFKPIGRERFLLAVPPDHPINDLAYTKDHKRFIDIRETQGLNFIFTQPEQRTRQRCDAILSKAGVSPKVKYVTSNIQTAARMAGSGLGFTLIPELYTQLFGQSLAPCYYHIEEAYEAHWDLAVCYAKDEFLSKPAEEMIRICESIMPDMHAIMNHRPGESYPV